MNAPSLHSDAGGFTPKLITVLAQGYRWPMLKADAVAGLTVAVVALPLAMAIAISSGVGPERGLFTAIIAGALISALGGSMHQIGGPTAAFIVVVAGVVERQGYDGLVLATAMAGAVLIIVGALRLGTLIRLVPHTVVIGFTSGIALSILASQLRDVLGLPIALPADFIPKLRVAAAHLSELNLQAIGLTVFSVGSILALRAFRPKWPVFLIVVVVVSIAATGVHLNVETIGSRFGAVPSALPAPHLPLFEASRVLTLLPDALTIAFLAGIESLLSAVVADGMASRRHRSNIELIAQGIANLASVCFGGIPATGAIARTATNIRSGAKTPIAGILHAVFLALFMAVFAPVMRFIPLSALASVLVVVAWSIAESHQVKMILLKRAWGEKLVLVATLSLTLMVDLTIGIVSGLALSALVHFWPKSKT